jgi:hypothetical protein
MSPIELFPGGNISGFPGIFQKNPPQARKRENPSNV